MWLGMFSSSGLNSVSTNEPTNSPSSVSSSLIIFEHSVDWDGDKEVMGCFMIVSKVGECVDEGIWDVAGIRNGGKEIVVSTTNVSNVVETIIEGLH